MVAVLDAGLGATGAASATTSGTVVSVHRRAAYVRLGGELVALVAPGVDPGPLHVRCAALPVLRPGEEVTADRGRLAGPGWALRLPEEPWRGALPDPAALAGADDGTLREAASGAEVPTGGPAELAAVLGGRGPGLTPAGDDVLAGVVLVARVAGGPAAEERLRAVVAGIRTTEVSRTFLGWAARGQSIAPVHDWLLALSAGDARAARQAFDRLCSVGADSGRSLAAGLARGVGQLPRSATQTARAGTSPGLRH